MTKQFQYEIQSFQEDCINTIVSILEDIFATDAQNYVLKGENKKESLY